MNTLTLLIAAGAIALTHGVAFAESHEADPMAGMDHSTMDHSPEAMAKMSPAMQGYMDAMDTMMKGMSMTSTGDPDADFLMMMIPHHQSAIDMAKVELKEGDDEGTKAMAQKVIDAQEAEIAEMKAMLAAMGQ